MPRPKGSPNEITSEVRSKLQFLMDSIDLNDLDCNQIIKILQIALQSTLPKLKQETDEVEYLTLFVD